MSNTPHQNIALEPLKWRITDIWGAQYVVMIDKISKYRDGSISGEYWFNGSRVGVGCFPLEDIICMEKVLD